MAGNLRPLRGRVAIAPVAETHIGLIHMPDYQPEWDRRDQRASGVHARSSHRGHVLAMGGPAEKYGHPVPHRFSVGDEVVYVYAAGGTEESRRGYYGSSPCVWVTQEEVIAVICRKHVFSLRVRSDNADRIREFYSCDCGACYSRLFAKRGGMYDGDENVRLGEWTESEEGDE